MTGLLGHMLDLRDNFTVYGAAYLVLAQALEATVVSADAKLREAARLGIDVRVFDYAMSLSGLAYGPADQGVATGSSWRLAAAASRLS